VLLFFTFMASFSYQGQNNYKDIQKACLNYFKTNPGLNITINKDDIFELTDEYVKFIIHYEVNEGLLKIITCKDPDTYNRYLELDNHYMLARDQDNVSSIITSENDKNYFNLYFKGTQDNIELKLKFDTGATKSCIPSQTLNDLEKILIGETTAFVADGSSSLRNIYRIKLYISNNYVNFIVIELNSFLLGMSFISCLKYNMDNGKFKYVIFDNKILYPDNWIKYENISKKIRDNRTILSFDFTNPATLDQNYDNFDSEEVKLLYNGIGIIKIIVCVYDYINLTSGHFNI